MAMAKTRHSIDERGRGWVRGTSGDRFPARPGEGFTLIEVLVAMGVMAMMMISIVQLFVMAAYVNKSVEQRTRLANIAQMQTEELRRMYMSLPQGFTTPTAILPTLTVPYDAFDGTEFKDQWNSGHAAIYLVATKPDPADPGSYPDRSIRTYEAYTINDTFPSGFGDINNVIDVQKGASVEALVAWWVSSAYAGQGLEMRIAVHSGHTLGNTPLLKDVSVSYTTVFANPSFYISTQ
jgi:prepilin-type N-terminal cleavage/methylation domain-containing protein